MFLVPVDRGHGKCSFMTFSLRGRGVGVFPENWRARLVVDTDAGLV